MSGPCCDTCKWFYPAILGDKSVGECTDPSKRVFYKYGGAVNDPPSVTTTMTCNNWTDLRHQQETEAEKEAGK